MGPLTATPLGNSARESTDGPRGRTKWHSITLSSGQAPPAKMDRDTQIKTVRSALSRDSHANGQRLDRMQHAVHHAGLAHGGPCGRRPRRGEAHREQRIRFEQRTIGIGDLVGAAVKQIKCIELAPPAIVKAIAELPMEEPGCRRNKGIVFGERARSEIAIAQACEPAGPFSYSAPG